jgi:polyisoprenoid-binding protein YceI
MIRFALAFMLLCSSVAGAADTVVLNDPMLPLNVKASHANFSVQHLLIDRVNGSVPIVSAAITLGADGLTPTSVEATLNPARINTGDDDRDGNLTGSDWFDTKKFPLWTFKSNSVVASADGTYAIAGMLTIHGVGVPVTLATSLVRKAPHPLYHATTTVDRHAFGMVVTRTDALVGNDVTISLDVQAQ